MINAEMITAFSVFLGALFGGIVAVIAELRKPEARRAARAAPSVAGSDEPQDPFKTLASALREEADHTNRTIWIVEKKLTDHLHRLELALAAQRGAPPGP